MGWDYTVGASRSDVIHELTQPWHTTTGDTCTTLKSAIRGNVLWVVQEFVGSKERWIGCYLLGSNNGSWGYKAMDESVHPYYYSCPLHFLDLVPQVTSAEWREKVRLYHTQAR